MATSASSSAVEDATSAPAAHADASVKAAVYDKLIADLRAFFGKYGAGIDAHDCASPTCERGSALSMSTLARMATLNSFTARAHPHMHFVGFYLVAGAGDAHAPTRLLIGPYTGDVLATPIIAFGAGQCGTCAALRETVIAEDVSTCANYIACDDVTRSEIVVPVFSGIDGHDKKLIAVWDIDSPVLAGFDEVDKRYLEAMLREFVR